MQWRLRTDDANEVATLAEDVDAYLRRFGEPESDFPAAGAALRDLVRERSLPAAGGAWVHVDWSGEVARLDVRGDEDGPEQGARTVALPVTRRRPPPAGPRQPQPGTLPAHEEARKDGSFGRESFLRALVVQMAQTLEREQGPAVAEAVVEQVGTDIGERMEDEYRRARGIVERLRPEQMADLFVRLKHAIDGRFFVIEVTEERIVLGNRQCPFGDAVRRAPGLCRTTSSVFGGIAARNAGAATVQLDQRIAAGDPECRVTVWLGERPGRPTSLRIVLGEQYAYLRAGLIDVLAGSGMAVVGHASTPGALLRAVERDRPDVAIIDFSEANTDQAIATAAAIRERFPEVAVLVLAEHLQPAAARELLGRHPDRVGYVLKDALSRDELVAAVRRVAEGGAALDPDIVPELVGATDPLDALTPKELEVLELLAEGLTNQAIAERLVVTKRAVEKHVGNIFRKLPLTDSPQQERRVLAARLFLDSR